MVPIKVLYLVIYKIIELQIFGMTYSRSSHKSNNRFICWMRQLLNFKVFHNLCDGNFKGSMHLGVKKTNMNKLLENIWMYLGTHVNISENNIINVELGMVLRY
jgi:hypothetical protein